MTKSTITRERIQRIIRAIDSESYDEEEIREWLTSDEIMELARMALAAMDSEPVAWVWQHLDNWHVTNYEERARDLALGGVNVEPLYRHAQPASERDQVRIAHAEWSQATFGNVGPVCPLKHLSKEALEAAEQPGDLSEWADMQFLLWDAQRRAGITDEQITQAMIEKLAVNKQRSWPEPKYGEPRLHIKEQQAPVVEREPIAWLNDAYLARGVVDGEAGSEDAGPGYIPVYREAGPQPAPVVHGEIASAIEELKRTLVDCNRYNYCSDAVARVEGACRAAMLAAAPQEVK